MTSRSFGRGEEKGDKYQTAKIPLRPQMSPLSFMYPCVNPFVHLLLKGDSSSGYLRFLRTTGAGSRLEEFRPLRTLPPWSPSNDIRHAKTGMQKTVDTLSNCMYNLVYEN
jgi:hypothetical protein